MAENNPPTTQSVPAPAALAVAPDATTAALLSRYAAGDKLTAAEYGRLGQWKRTQNGQLPARVRPAQPAGAAPAVGQPAVAVGGAGAPPGDGLAPVPVDTALVRGTTEAVLKTLDGIAQRWIAGEGIKIGASPDNVKRLVEAAALPHGPRDLMVQTSPEVLASMGVDARNYPVAAFCTGLGTWAASLGLVVASLRSLGNQRAKQQEAETRRRGEAEKN